MKVIKIFLIPSMLILITLLSACGPSAADLTPTLTVDEIETLVMSTLSVDMTQTALAAPTQTSTLTITPTPTALAAPTLSALTTPIGTSAGSIPVTSCYALSFLSDVTIPDNTSMSAGESFTKTWSVRNSGACAWDAGFKFAFTTGDAMGGSTYTLTQAVPANTDTNLSIKMIAPNKSGAVKSSWRMSTAGGQFFGDEIYVLIMVSGAASNTSVPAASTSTTGPSAAATSTPTATSTP